MRHALLTATRCDKARLVRWLQCVPWFSGLRHIPGQHKVAVDKCLAMNFCRTASQLWKAYQSDAPQASQLWRVFLGPSFCRHKADYFFAILIDFIKWFIYPKNTQNGDSTLEHLPDFVKCFIYRKNTQNGDYFCKIQHGKFHPLLSG